METLREILRGEMTPGLRVWTSLAPALLVTAWFLIGLVVWAIRTALWGLRRDEETARRGGSVLVSEYLRHYFFWLTGPLWRLVERSRVPPDAITTLSALLATASGVASAAGRFALAGWLFIFSGVLDTFDGRLARLRRTDTPWGAAIDSTLDRWSDSAVLAGLAWYYRDTWVLVPVLLSMIGTGLVPYVRARGEGLGVQVRDGLMQRTERVMYLGAAVALSPVLEALLFPLDRHPMHWLAVVALCALAVTSNHTAATRLLGLVRALQARSGAPAGPAPSRARSLWLSVAAAATATGADFAAAVWLVRAGAGPFTATAAGCLVGAIVAFALNRTLAFRSRGAPLPQAGRYALVSLTSLALNAGGVSLLLSHPGVAYPIAWWLVRAAVFLLWNYPLLADYVFGDADLGRRHAA